MREIKFRAWDGARMLTNCPNLMLDTSYGTPYWQFGFEEPKPMADTILMQFTGLHDKSGKEIYEGDIVGKKIDKDNLDYHNRQTRWLKVVKWNEEEGKWDVWEKYIDRDEEGLGPMYEEGWDDDFCGFGYEKVKVIGNIYSHPELLKP